MTGEEMERAIDFLLKSQANLEARIEQVNANLGARIEETNKLLGEYTQMQTTLVQFVTRTFAAQDKLHSRTDKKLNALIDTVNRMLISGDQGANP